MDKYGYIGIETLLNFCENSKDHAVTPNDFMRMNRARVPERKTGKWIRHPEWEADGGCGYECDQCGMGSDVDYNFCMRCGARMDRSK